MSIIVIGESCLDIFEYGNCTRLNPEAPTPVFISKRKVENLGMASNVHANVRSLNYYASVLLTHNEQISKHRFVDETSNYILLRVDKDVPVSKISFLPYIVEAIREAEAVIVSDYNKGFMSESDLEIIAHNSKLSFLDTKKALGSWASEFSWIKINQKEYENPAHQLHHLDPHKIIVTMGGKGARIGETFYEGVPSEVRDVVGAGDSFLAAFSVAYTKTRDLKKSMDFANLAGSHVVKKRGVADLADLQNSIP
jgi:D-beta-D-heptose 7-phosphate kinase/D-beta-D-heptose 1-phosphate adenosyltransferase